MGVVMAIKSFPVGTKVILNAQGKRNLSDIYHDLEGVVVAATHDSLYVIFEGFPYSIVCFESELVIINDSKRTATIEWV